MGIPGRANIRRVSSEQLFTVHGVAIADLMGVDSMLSALNLVPRSDLVAVLPGVSCAGDSDVSVRFVHPLAGPDLRGEAVTITPRRRAMLPAVRALHGELASEIRALASPPGV